MSVCMVMSWVPKVFPLLSVHNKSPDISCHWFQLCHWDILLSDDIRCELATWHNWWNTNQNMTFSKELYMSPEQVMKHFTQHTKTHISDISSNTLWSKHQNLNRFKCIKYNHKTIAYWYWWANPELILQCLHMSLDVPQCALNGTQNSSNVLRCAQIWFIVPRCTHMSPNVTLRTKRSTWVTSDQK